MDLSRRRKRQINRLLAVLFAIILAVVLLYGNILLVSQQKQQERQQITAMVGMLREEMPSLSDKELMDLIKDPDEIEHRLERGELLLQKYGYDDRFFAKQERENMWQLILFNSSVIFITALTCILMYALHRRRVHREVRRLQRYFDDLNHGSYDLEPGQAVEGDLSMLQSDIFKVTQLLRTSAEREKAKSEGARLLDDARKAIEQEKKAAIADIRAQVATLSVEIAEKVLRQNLKDDQSQMDLIDRMLDDISSTH